MTSSPGSGSSDAARLWMRSPRMRRSPRVTSGGSKLASVAPRRSIEDLRRGGEGLLDDGGGGRRQLERQRRLMSGRAHLAPRLSQDIDRLLARIVLHERRQLLLEEDQAG